MPGTRQTETVELTLELTLRQLDRCRMMVWCQGRCGMGVAVSVASLIASYGLDAKVSDPVPKLYCRRCKWRVPVRVEIERMTGIYRPVGDQPFYF